MTSRKSKTKTISVTLPDYTIELIDGLVEVDLRGWLVAWAVHSYVESEGGENIRRQAEEARARVQRDEILSDAWTVLGEFFEGLNNEDRRDVSG